MARPSKTRRLGVWMNGQVVGIWTLGSNGQHTFAYHEDWLVSPLGRALSLSLPLRPVSAPYRGAVVAAFPDNLLSSNRHDHWQDILPRDWLSTARICGIDRDVARAIIGDLVEATPKVVATALPGGFPASVSGPILRGLETSARRLAALA